MIHLLSWVLLQQGQKTGPCCCWSDAYKSSETSPEGGWCVVHCYIYGDGNSDDDDDWILQGVKFMFDCVTGVQIEGSTGCIMADEMVG